MSARPWGPRGQFGTARRRTKREANRVATNQVDGAQASGWKADRARELTEQHRAEAQAAHHAVCGEHDEAQACFIRARAHAAKAQGLLDALRTYSAGPAGQPMARKTS